MRSKLLGIHPCRVEIQQSFFVVSVLLNGGTGSAPEKNKLIYSS